MPSTVTTRPSTAGLTSRDFWEAGMQPSSRVLPGTEILGSMLSTARTLNVKDTPFTSKPLGFARLEDLKYIEKGLVPSPPHNHPLLSATLKTNTPEIEDSTPPALAVSAAWAQVT